MESDTTHNPAADTGSHDSATDSDPTADEESDDQDQNSESLFPNHFPAEVIAEILKHTRGYSTRGDVALSPWWMGHICGFIRAVALHTQQLWSDIRIDSVRDSARGSPPWVPEARLQAQLTRSGVSGLYVYFRGGPYQLDDHDFHQTYCTDITLVLLLAQASERWVEATFEMGTSLFCYFAKIQGHIPNLRYLGLRNALRIYASPPPPCELFSSAPSLMHLQEAGTFLANPPLPTMTYAVPGAQLVSLCTYWRLALFTSVLPQMPNLEELTVGRHCAANENAEGIMAAPKLTLARLRLLRTETLLILAPMILPCLEELVVEDLEEWRVQELGNFLARSPLTRLKRMTIMDEGRDVSRLMADSPFTTHLTLPIHDAHDWTLERLQGGVGEETLAPQVTDLTLLIQEHIPAGEFDRGSMISLELMLNSRRNGWHGCRQLRSLTITSHQLSAAQIEALRAFERQGLELTLIDFRPQLIPAAAQPTWSDDSSLGPWIGWHPRVHTRYSDALDLHDWMRGV